MAKQDKYTISNLRKDFPDDNACLEFVFNALHSKKCSCGGEYKRVKGRKQYQCSKCRYQIAPMAGTIFEKSTTPLTLWFHALFVFSNAKSGISAKELERQIGTTYKTAWRILTLIRKTLAQGSNKLEGDVEMDETYIGGRKSGGKNNQDLSKAIKEKSTVIGAIERGEQAKAQVSPDAKAVSIKRFLYENIDLNSRLLTDKSNRYNQVAWEYDRHFVDHAKKEYARGDIHTNTIESFWSHVKRSINGTYKSVSKKYLQSYLDAFVFHYNNQHSDTERFVALLGALLAFSKD